MESTYSFLLETRDGSLFYQPIRCLLIKELAVVNAERRSASKFCLPRKPKMQTLTTFGSNNIAEAIIDIKIENRMYQCLPLL